MDDGGIALWERQMAKIVALISRRPDLSREQFLERWQVEHPRYVRELPGLRRYVQNAAIEHRKPWPYDGAAELWFDDLRSIAVAFDSAAADALRAHEESFIGELEWFVCTEQDVPLDGEPA